MKAQHLIGAAVTGGVLMSAATAHALTLADEFYGTALNSIWTLDQEPASFAPGGGVGWDVQPEGALRFNNIYENGYGHIETTIDTTNGARVDAIIRDDTFGSISWGTGPAIYYDNNNWVQIKIFGASGGMTNTTGWVAQVMNNGVLTQTELNGYQPSANPRFDFYIGGVELTASNINIYTSPIPAVPSGSNFGGGANQVDSKATVALTLARPASFTGTAKAIIGKGYSNSTSYPNPNFDNGGGGISPGYSIIDYVRIQDSRVQTGRAGFGKQWVRDNVFTIQGASEAPSTWDTAEYFGANFTVLNRDAGNPNTILNIPPQYADKTWHGFVSPGVSVFEDIKNIPNNTAWIIRDEPNRQKFGEVAAIYEHIHAADPNALTYTTLGHDEWGAQYWYGNTSNPSYTYSQYIDDFINNVRPDVLAYDKYSLYGDGSTNADYLRNVMTIRNKAIAADIPYFGWVQGFPVGSRQISESDNRWNVYTHLTAGYTGLLYWTYDYYAGSGPGLIDQAGNQTPLYNIVRDTNAEAQNLGTTLRFLESSDVRFVSGGVGSTPNGLTIWSSGAGGDSKLISLSLTNSDANAEKDGLIGFFTDDDSQQYFMLMNLFHAANMSAATGSINFTLTFASDVNAIYRLNRLTGVPERVDLSSHVLNLSLPGGTGDLFKYNNGYFAGITPGDTDLDGDVDLSDLGNLATHYGASSGGLWGLGDFDLDGDIDLNDLGVLATYYGAGSAQALSDFQSLMSIPEPAGAASALLGIVLLRKRVGRR